jgi:hypothetical protein
MSTARWCGRPPSLFTESRSVVELSFVEDELTRLGRALSPHSSLSIAYLLDRTGTAVASGRLSISPPLPETEF